MTLSSIFISNFKCYILWFIHVNQSTSFFFLASPALDPNGPFADCIIAGVPSNDLFEQCRYDYCVGSDSVCVYRLRYAERCGSRMNDPEFASRNLTYPTGWREYGDQECGMYYNNLLLSFLNVFAILSLRVSELAVIVSPPSSGK